MDAIGPCADLLTARALGGSSRVRAIGWRQPRLVYLGGAPIKVPLQLIEASGRAPSLRCLLGRGRSPSVIDRSACKADADRVMTRGREGIVSLEYIRACLCVVWFAASSARDASGSGQEAT